MSRAFGKWSKCRVLAFLAMVGTLWAQPDAGQSAAEGGEVDSEMVEGGEVTDVLKPLEKDVLANYLSTRPERYLVDPQHVLGGLEAADRLGFLQYHAGDSAVDLFVFLFREDQKLPDSAEVNDFMERHFAEGKPSVIACFAYGDPARSELYLSRAVAEGVVELERRRALDSAVLAALEVDDAGGQLEAFLMQVSMRVYWMERAMGLVDQDVVKPEGRELPEVEREEIVEAGLLERLEPYFREGDRWMGKVAAVCGAMSLLSLLVLWTRARARYEFADLSVESRLGGRHGAGVGAVISFASAAVPPGSQRDFDPDVLRRL